MICLLQTITDPANGLDAGAGQFFPQVVNIEVDIGKFDIRGVAPDLVEDSFFGDYLPGIAHQQFEQQRLFHGQTNGFAVNLDFTSHGVERKASDRNNIFGQVFVLPA